MKLGKIIKAYRKENKVTQAEFGERAGLTKAYISMLERNKNSRNGQPLTPTVETLRKVSKVMGISLGELLLKMEDEYINVAQNAIGDEQAELLNEYNKLSPESKNLVMGLLKQMNVSQNQQSNNVNQTINGNSNIVAGGNQYLGGEKINV